MVNLSEHLDDTSVVDTRDHHAQKISQERRLLLQIERERLVVATDDM